MTIKQKCPLSPNNILWKYIKFTKKDGYISDFVDYCAFYGSWQHEKLLNLDRSDNWASLYIDNILAVDIQSYANFQAYVSVCVLGVPVKICRLKEVRLGSKIVLSVHVYGKGCKVIREDWLWPSVYKFFTMYCGLDEITITRIDYTCDCSVMNFNKKNYLTNSVCWYFTKKFGRWKKKEELTYKLFGRKWSDSARFLRYYNKKEEILKRWTAFLYPEYEKYANIMRYELQINSKWFDDFDRCMSVDKLESIITMWNYIKNSSGKHYTKNKDESLEKVVLDGIRKLIKIEDSRALDRIKLLINGSC